MRLVIGIMMAAGFSLASGCDDSGNNAAPDLSITGLPDLLMTTGLDGSTDSGIPFQALAPCANPGDYMAAATATPTITFGPPNVYSPKCLTVHVGDTVTWSGTFSFHPLKASTRGTQPSPIPSQNMGMSTPVTFHVTGFYPYFCTVHGSDSGVAMAGVVQVVP